MLRKSLRALTQSAAGAPPRRNFAVEQVRGMSGHAQQLPPPIMDTPEQSVIAYKKRLEARRLYPANGKFAEGDEAFKRPNEGRLPRRFAKVEQRLRVPQGALNVHDALAIVCELALMPEYKKNFDEGVEIAIGLSVDPRKPNNQIRGACELPEGTGKTFRVAAFGLDPEQLAAAEAAGAAAFGGEDLIEVSFEFVSKYILAAGGRILFILCL